MKKPFEDLQGNCRILYLVGQLGTGGLERQLCYLLKTMNRERCLPLVVVWNYKENDVYVRQIEALGVKVLGIPKSGGGSLKLLTFCRLVRILQPELVHSYTFYTNFAAWFATWGTSSIAIGSIRQNFISERKKSGRILGRLSAHWPSVQICNSLAAKQTAENSMGYWKPKTIFLVRNSLDLNQFLPTPLPDGYVRILAIGRLYPEKRWDRLLKSLAIIARQGLQFELFHAGDGPLRTNLETQALKLGITHIIHFLGAQRNIMGLFQRSTFLVHTADDEGCPNVVMEAMACGRAVVATDAGDVPYLIEDGKTGFVVKRGDDTLLSKRISRLIVDRTLCRRMGEAGRVKAESQFGLDRLLLGTLSAYKSTGWNENGKDNLEAR